MKIAASRELCQGHGQCELFAPDVFEIDDDALVVVKTETIDPARQGDVEEAISHCPEQAITVTEA